MIEQRMSLTKSEAGAKRRNDEFLGASNRMLEVAAARQMRRNRRRKCASGAMRVPRYPVSPDHDEAAAVIKQIGRVRIGAEMATLDNHGACTELDESPRRLMQVGH